MQLVRAICTIVVLMICFRIAHDHWPEIQHALDQAARNGQAAAQNSGSGASAQAEPDWTIAYKKDAMTDEKTLEATSAQWAEGGGYFSIRAECDEASRVGITLVIDYFADKGQDAHYMMTGRGDVPVEVRLDNQAAKSLATGTKFNNETNILWLDNKADVGGGAGGLLFGLVAALSSAGKPEELVAANTLRVRLQLTDGRNPIVVIGLQDPDLQRFFARCGFPGRGAQTRANSQTGTTGPSNSSNAAAAPQNASQSFQNGLSDRQSWEKWVGSLSGDAYAGATFWAGERSKSSPGSCNDGPGQSSAAYRQSCASAKQFLTPTDARRKAEPEYRRGWNTY